jgi:DtxR family transcriptional regulator, Mn-dependent transcriptional regulator
VVQTSKSLSASLEDYMEAIFHIEDQKHAARAKDIAVRLQVSSASVTGALRLLSEKELINYEPYDLITLTSKGRKVALDVVQRHEMLRDFFVKILAIDEAEAEASACKMEHGVSPKILERLTKFIKFLEVCPRGGHTWLKEFETFCARGEHYEQCEACLRQCIQELQNRCQAAPSRLNNEDGNGH